MLQFGVRIPGEAYPRRTGAYAVMFNDRGQIGLIRRPKGYFLPGGGMDPGEEPETALQRELVEETGHTVKNLRYIGEASRFGHANSLGYFEAHGRFYLADFGAPKGEQVEADHELVWVAPEQAAELLWLEHQAWAVRLGIQQRSPGR